MVSSEVIFPLACLMLELTSLRKFPVVTGKRILNLFEMRVQAKYESYHVNPQNKHSFATLPVSKAWKLAQSERESVNCTGEENFNDFSFTSSHTKNYLLKMHDWSAPSQDFQYLLFKNHLTSNFASRFYRSRHLLVAYLVGCSFDVGSK